MVKLGLTREDLAKFLPDHRSIRAFEKLFVDIDKESDVNIELIESIGLSAESASSNALLALALINAIAEIVEFKEKDPSFFYDEIEDSPLPTYLQEQSNSVDYLEFNTTQFPAKSNMISFNGSSMLVGGVSITDATLYMTITNNSTIAITKGMAVGLSGSIYRPYDSNVAGIYLIGIASTDIAIGQSGKLVTSGVADVSTASFSIGDKLYSDGLIAGKLNNTSGLDVGFVTATDKILVRM